MAGRRRTGGCSITSFLGFLIFIVLILIGVLLYFFLKDSTWVQNRMNQLQQKAGNFMHLNGTDLANKKLSPEIRSEANKVLKNVQRTAETLKEKATNVSRTLVTDHKQESKTEKKPVVKNEKPADKTVIQEKKTAVPKETSLKKTGTLKEVKKSLPVNQNAIKKEAKLNTARIYFIRYSAADKSIQLVPAVRPRTLGDSPLYDTLKALVEGPDDKEDAAGLSTAIPGGVKLNSLKVQDGIAYIDVSDNFENDTGGQLMRSRVYQVVYTATEYPTVKKVLITVNGQKRTNFGGEGLDLTKPLGRLSGTPKF